MPATLRSWLESRQAHGAPPPQLSLNGPDADLSSGEASFLWAFAQASIMLPEVRARLRRSWGLCERHAAGWLVVEAAFRHAYLHGPAVLYDDLMDIAVGALDAHGPLAAERIAWQLAARGPCHLCGMGVGAQSTGFIRPERWRAACDARLWTAFMRETRADWRPQVCGRCDGSGRAARCRIHLVDDLVQGRPLGDEGERVRRIAARVHRYDRSFRWECQGSDTREDRAALVAAIGWCSGWSALLALDAATVPEDAPRATATATATADSLNPRGI